MMGKEEKDFVQALSDLAKNLKELKKEIENEINTSDIVEETTNEETFTISEIKKLIEEASEETEKELEEMMQSKSVGSMLMRIQSMAVMEMFKSNIMERVDDNE